VTPAAALLLLGVGMALGAVLLLSGFGFTAQFRAALARGDLSGVRAQVLLLGLSTLTVASGIVMLPEAWPLQAPIGVAFVLGALLFGAAMQLANGCASGALFALGGGSPRMALVLAGFIFGGFVGSLHLPAWEALPRLPPVLLLELMRPGDALLLQVSICAAVVFALKRHAMPPRLVWGAIGLALLNLAVLAITGLPWSVTWAFALWGARLAVALGWPAEGTFWGAPEMAEAMTMPLWQDPTTVTDIGVILGAFATARITGHAAPARLPGWRPWLAAALGGIAMGYGARLSYGCNIGAFISGAASTSLHGWLWGPIALAGSWFGMRLRPAFGLARG
jgi:uncharacterized membrane protein YedE/YeeE